MDPLEDLGIKKDTWVDLITPKCLFMVSFVAISDSYSHLLPRMIPNCRRSGRNYRNHK
jgi:hypothetical protein